VAFSSGIVWEVKTSGDDTNNGGGFNTGSTFAADLVATSGTTAAPVLSSASYNFTANDVGHYVFIKSGTNWLPGFYKITSVGSNKATVDATTGHVVQYDSTYGARGIRTTTGCVNSSYAGGATGTWGVDYSQKDDGSTILTFTDMVIDGTTNTKFTSAGNPVGKNFIGNVISITSGTGFTVQRVAIISTATTTATCDKSLGTLGSTGGNGKMGGALASIGKASSLATVGGSTFIKSGSYNISSASTSVAGGCFSNSVGTGLVGYGTWRGDMTSPPVLTATGSISNFNVIKSASPSSFIKNITVDCSSYTTSTAFAPGAASLLQKCIAKNCTNGGFNETVQNATYIDCVATGCSGVSAFIHNTTNVFIGCVAYANSVTGFTSSTSNYFFCISANNSGASSDGFSFSGSTGNSLYLNCTSYGNGRHGFNHHTAPPQASTYQNCVSEGNGGWAYTSTGSSRTAYYFYCAHFDNDSGGIDYTSTADTVEHEIAYSVSAFNNPGSNDFSLNTAVGGGMSLKGQGFPGAFLNSMGTTGYVDLGAVQAPTAASGFAEHAFGFVGAQG
jgi:hypothetical protein